MIVYLDFDGTMVEHSHPTIGRFNPKAFEVVRKLQTAGHEIILNTYRADLNDGTLEKALEYLNTQSWYYLQKVGPDLEIQPIKNWNPYKWHPSPWDWDTIMMTDNIFIDDCAPGIPLIPQVMTPGKMVNWNALDLEFDSYGIYQPEILHG